MSTREEFQSKIRTFNIIFTSSEAITVEGIFIGPVLDAGSCTVVIKITKDQDLLDGKITENYILALDARVLILDAENNQIFYNPRSYMEGMTEPAKGWMEKHFGWPLAYLLMDKEERAEVLEKRAGEGEFYSAELACTNGYPGEEIKRHTEDVEWERFGESIKID